MKNRFKTRPKTLGNALFWWTVRLMIEKIARRGVDNIIDVINDILSNFWN